MAVRSVTGLSGWVPKSVVQNPDQRDFSGNIENTPLMTASSRTNLPLMKIRIMRLVMLNTSRTAISWNWGLFMTGNRTLITVLANEWRKKLSEKFSAGVVNLHFTSPEGLLEIFSKFSFFFNFSGLEKKLKLSCQNCILRVRSNHLSEWFFLKFWVDSVRIGKSPGEEESTYRRIVLPFVKCYDWNQLPKTYQSRKATLLPNTIFSFNCHLNLMLRHINVVLYNIH